MKHLAICKYDGLSRTNFTSQLIHYYTLHQVCKSDDLVTTKLQIQLKGIHYPDIYHSF